MSRKYLLGSAAVRPAIAADPLGNAYVAGQTPSGHAIVEKLSPDGSALLYTVLAGSGKESGAAISVDQNGNAYITGRTTSPDFPSREERSKPGSPAPPTHLRPRLDPSGNIVFATYLGGSGYDYGTAIQVDSGGYVHVAGATASLDFPTTAGSYEPQVLVPVWSD